MSYYIYGQGYSSYQAPANSQAAYYASGSPLDYVQVTPENSSFAYGGSYYTGPPLDYVQVTAENAAFTYGGNYYTPQPLNYVDVTPINSNFAPGGQFYPTLNHPAMGPGGGSSGGGPTGGGGSGGGAPKPQQQSQQPQRQLPLSQQRQQTLRRQTMLPASPAFPLAMVGSNPVGYSNSYIPPARAINTAKNYMPFILLGGGLIALLAMKKH